MDLMGVTQQLIAQTYDPMTWLLIAGAIYGVLTSIIVLLDDEDKPRPVRMAAEAANPVPENDA